MTQFIYYTSALELEAETLGNKLENSGPQRAITVPGKGRSNSQLLVQFFFIGLENSIHTKELNNVNIVNVEYVLCQRS